MRVVYVQPDSPADEIRLTVDAAIELTNTLSGDGTPIRSLLIEHGFSRAPTAGEAELAEVVRRFGPVAAIIATLPGAALADAVVAVNTELAACPLAPSVVAHDGAPLHIHWTHSTASFGVQVVADVLMALALTLCEHGTDRFGRCAAAGCSRLFYDATKNRSRRFCSDPRCASRTHTAQHRARLRPA
jgi:predicted RNA-binding Zn ribbon-like protein